MSDGAGGVPEASAPLGLDAGARRTLTLLCLAFAVLHLLFLSALLLVPGTFDRRWLAAAALVLLACCAASLERLLTGHPRAALVLAVLPTAACLLFDAYAFADGPSPPIVGISSPAPR